MLIHDFFVAHLINNQPQIKHATAGENNFTNISDIFTRIKLLSQAMLFDKTYAESGGRDGETGLRFLILKKKYDELIVKTKEDYLDQFNICPQPKIDDLPFHSFFLQFTFILAKPYLSKDDEAFYICENPVKKDKVFKVPMVSGSTWKGNMRWTAGRLLEMDTNIDERLKKRIRISNLFGNENETEERYFDSLMPEKKDDFKTIMRNLSNKEDLRRGRLNFYPTFFDKISLEVINPHDRKTKAGTGHIYIESVPDGARGTFSLLYVPFDLMGKLSKETKQQVAEDINLVYDSLETMMFTYGFSAKKSSGFGIISKDIKEGVFVMSGHPYKKNLSAPEPTKKRIISSFKELSSSKQTINQAKSSMFSSFSEIQVLIEQVKKEVIESAK